MVAAVNDPEAAHAAAQCRHHAGAELARKQFDKYLRAEIARWGKVIRDKGITGE